MPAVGETPEKKQIQNISELRGSKLAAPKAATQYIVADTMNSSYSAAENTDSQRKKPASKLTGSHINAYTDVLFHCYTD